MAYTTKNGITAIACDKCGRTDEADEKEAGKVFYDLGWGLFPRAKKYVHQCIDCLPKKFQRR